MSIEETATAASTPASPAHTEPQFSLAFETDGTYGRHLTIALLTATLAGMTVRTSGFAKCHKGDIPNKAVGRKLALRRAVWNWMDKATDLALLAGDLSLVNVRAMYRRARPTVTAIWDHYYATYEPHTARGKAAVRARQQRKAERAGAILTDPAAAGGPEAPNGDIGVILWYAHLGHTWQPRPIPTGGAYMICRDCKAVLPIYALPIPGCTCRACSPCTGVAPSATEAI